jgi:hypothetical protein
LAPWAAQDSQGGPALTRNAAYFRIGATAPSVVPIPPTSTGSYPDACKLGCRVYHPEELVMPEFMLLLAVERNLNTDETFVLKYLI